MGKDCAIDEVNYQESVEYSKSFPLVEKTIRATSASHRTEISCAFFSRPDRRFENVTCLLILFSILCSCTLPLPILCSVCLPDPVGLIKLHHTRSKAEQFSRCM
ncbi:unnamed protein product [Linum trigynum]|uniref:Uncharacterized protein n=1 Tax=Linum trigynum TaxID=586398 RepID=A0AAV2DZW9_9ROSI